MRRIKCIFSAIVILCFLFNTTLYTEAVSVLPKTNSNLHLSPSLKFGNLDDPQLKDMGRVEMALLTQLIEFSWREPKIEPDVLIKKATEYRDSKFANTHVFLAEREVLSNGKIKVKARIIRDDNDKTIATYYATFSTQKDENNGFDIDVYTETEWNENKKIIKEAEFLPKRESQYPKDAKAIARYIKHEQYADSLIKFAHKNGYAAEPELQAFNYKQEIESLVKKLGVEVSPNDLESMMNRKFFIINTNSVIIDKLKQITIVDQFEIEHDVVCFEHSSNNAVHVLAGPIYYEFITDGRKIDKENSFLVRNFLEMRLAHAIGVMLGLPILEVKGALHTNNILDQRWQILQKDPNAKFEKLNLHVVDLDNVRMRDYAMAGEIENPIYMEINFYRTAKNCPVWGKIENPIYMEINSQQKNPYWMAVKKDLSESIKADNMVKVNVNNQLVSALSGEEIKDYEKYTNILKLIHTSKKYIQELINSFDNKTDITEGKTFYENMPYEIKNWIDIKYLTITKEEDIKKMFTPENNVRQKLLNEALKWFKKALEAEIYINLGEAYASPTTKELAYVKSGVTKKGETEFYFGELFLRKIAAYGSIKKLMVLMFDEAMHIGKEDVTHGKIESIEDIDKKVDHILSLDADRFPMKEAEEAWEEAIEDKPWEANLPGANIGKTSEMIDFFERLEQFAKKDGKGTAFIYGPKGSGKNMAAAAVREMMNAAEKNVPIINCELLSGLDKKIQIEFINELKLGNAKLIIIDNLEYADESLEKLLKSIIDGILDAKVLCLGQNKECLLHPTKGHLHTRIEMFFEMPAVCLRGDDIVRLAEHFNKQASEEYHTAYAPIDRYFGENIKKVTEDGGGIVNPVSIWNLRKLIYNIAANRAILLKKKELPKGSPWNSGWRDSSGEVFSSLVITLSDVFYLGSFIENIIPEFKNLRKSGFMTLNEKYNELKTIMPYFEQLAPRDAQGKPTGFYKGLKGEQQGLPEKKKEEKLREWVKEITNNNPKEKEAQEVGIQIAPPVSNYTLFVSYDIATQEAFNIDKNISYASRFGLERIPTDSPKEIADAVIRMISTNNLNPKNIMVQLPEEFSKPEYAEEITKLVSKAPGIRFMVIDTKGLKDDKNTPKEKAQYRETIYSMMLLARHTDKENPNTKLDNLLKYFIDFCLNDSEEKDTLLDTYIKALKRDEIMAIAKMVLSYKYMTKHALPERAIISATLISA